VTEYYSSFIDAERDLYIIVEFCVFGELRRWIKRALNKDYVFLEPCIWEYSSHLANALVYIHAQRVLHRDIKPANIFLSSEGMCKLGDLGLGRIFDSTIAESQMQAFSKVGTPLYMSPEVGGRETYTMEEI
jgi:NIMA (never in mitosis gene a)-related kinase 7